LELDENANIISYEEYYPYGETSYRAGRNIAEVGLKRYRYTGKEKDEESGLYYYGARYYNSMIGIFISVDPEFEKYPEVSPYTYCLNNPMKFIDPDGKKVQIIFEENGQEQTVQYEDSKLYKLDGNEYTGDNEYATKVLEDLNQLSEDHKVLKDRLDDLVKSEKKHTIQFAEENYIISNETKDKNGIPTDSRTRYNPYLNIGEGDKERVPRAGLAHELLGHAWDADKGTSKYNKVNDIYV
jgi:RHS repeat-associated protein